MIMNTIILICDSIPANVARVVDYSADTNREDVKIVLIVCLTILIIAVIAAIVIVKLQNNHFEKEKELEKIKFDNNEAIKRNEFQLYKDRQDYDRAHKTSNQSSNTNQDEALDMLKEIVQLTKDKDGKADEDFSEGLFDLYIKIKQTKDN